jgi:hypothetical protein
MRRQTQRAFRQNKRAVLARMRRLLEEFETAEVTETHVLRPAMQGPLADLRAALSDLTDAARASEWGR